MKFENIQSHEDLTRKIAGSPKSYLLLYKEGSEQSMCAINNLKELEEKSLKVNVFIADVSKVRDIHVHYNITTVPALLEFNHDKFVRTIKGCHDKSYFLAVFENTTYSVSGVSDNKNQKRVIVYSTPTCPHCTNLKNYLKEQKIKFRDIDVSKDQKMAQELVKKSGQQGVPQTEINGRIIVGFDKAKIDQILEIRS